SYAELLTKSQRCTLGRKENSLPSPRSGWRETAFPGRFCGRMAEANMRTRTLMRAIESWARHRNDECFCDTCVAREIGAPDRKAVARATSELCTMHAAQFSRYHGRCTSCGTPSTVIAANRLVWA